VPGQRDGSGYRVVAAVDGSDPSVAALRWAALRAELARGSVDAVMAWQYPADLTGYGYPPIATIDDVDYAQIAEQVVADAIGQAVGRGVRVPVRPVVAEGRPADVLIEAAAGADLLVVGSRGHGGFTRALLGSLSRYCTEHAPCPVAVIRCHYPG
jgi:nucleotide-binding universal stress UspA family protein